MYCVKIKYLELILSEHLDYAKMIAKSAGRDLELLIDVCKASGGMPYDVGKKSYDALM